MDQAFSYRSPVAMLISSNEMEITCDINVSFVSHTSTSMTMTVPKGKGRKMDESSKGDNKSRECTK